jgi:hypothetical protein
MILTRKLNARKPGNDFIKSAGLTSSAFSRIRRWAKAAMPGMAQVTMAQRLGNFGAARWGSGSRLAEPADLLQNVRMFRNVWLPLFLSSLLLLAGVDHSAAQPPVLERLHIPNPVADVSAGYVMMPVEITYTAPDHLQGVGFFLTSPTREPIFNSYHSINGSGIIIGSGPLRPSSEGALRGTSRSGTYRLQLYVPRSIAPGPLVLTVALYDQMGASSFYGPGVARAFIPEGGPPLPGGSNTGITVINSNPLNGSVPELHHFRISPAGVDLSAGQQTVTVNATASDASGIAGVSVRIVAPNGDVAARLSMNGTHRISGDEFSGTYQATLTIPPWLPPGQYNAVVGVSSSIQKYLAVGYPGSPPAPAGVQTTLEIQNTGPVDSLPELLAISSDRSVVDVTDAAQTVNVNISAGGGLSGLTSISVGLYRADGSPTMRQRSIYSDNTSPFETLIERRNGAVTIPRFMEPGIYYWRVFLSKPEGVLSYRGYGRPGDSPFPGGFTGQLEILNSGMVGSHPPVITNLAITPDNHSVYDLYGLVEFTVEAKDNLGVTRIDASLLNTSPYGDLYAETASLKLIQGTALSGTWRGRSKVEGDPGSHLIRLTIQDTTGNWRVYQEIFESWDFSSEYAVPIPAALPSRFTINSSFSGGRKDPYTVWRRGHTGLAGPQGALPEDPDGDGIPNGLEFICGTDPLLPSHIGGPDPKALLAPKWLGNGLEVEVSRYNSTFGWGPTPVLKGWKSSTLAPGSWVPVTPQYYSEKQRYLLDAPAPNRRQQFLRLTVEP